MNFEIHITGDKSILKLKDVKTISVDLLRPDGRLLRTEYMTSQRMKFPGYSYCKEYVDFLVFSLNRRSIAATRIKIESEYLPEYVNDSYYLESHFYDDRMIYPSSKNQNKTQIMATDRTYDHSQYMDFLQQYVGKEIELCLYDTNFEQDKDWFKLYETVYTR